MEVLVILQIWLVSLSLLWISTARASSCPDPESIQPCTCINFLSGLNVICSAVDSELRLGDVFANPFSHINQFEMRNNHQIRVLRNGVFGSATFTRFDMRYGSLSEVQEGALSGAYTTVKEIHLYYNHLTGFPDVTPFTALELLWLHHNNIREMPYLESNTLTGIRLASNPLTEIPVNAVQHLPQLEGCDFQNTSLAAISPGTFTSLSKLHSVFLQDNAISYLREGTIQVAGRGIVDLQNNNLATIEYNAIQGTGDFLFLQNNALTTLEKKVFKPLLEGFMTVHLEDNPLACGCDILWLITNKTKYPLTKEVKCFDGTLLADLDPTTYGHCRIKLPSPWSYRCVNSRCVKEEHTGVSPTRTLAFCKLTCGEYGVLWPRPTTATIGNDVAEFLPTNMTLQKTCHEGVCQLLDDAFDIFRDNLHRHHPDYSQGAAPWEGPWDPDTVNHNMVVEITVEGGEVRLSLDTEESYSLTISTSGRRTFVRIMAPSFFGARHALETLSQLIEYEENRDTLMVVNQATITDRPAFAYRGILLDTSRNFFSVKSIERTLDAMAANKLNTFHWHITDSHSFPLHLETLPKMTYYGAYSSRQIYYAADVRHLVEYGRVRGIRVLPEFDAPAHVGNGWQWAEKQGLGKLAVCVNREPWQSYCLEPPCGQLNLANPKMYDVLGQIYNELVELFSPIDLFHYGGDEVNLNCWNTTDEMVNWMKLNNYGLDADAYYNQWSVFQEKSRKLLTTANKNKEVPGILWTSHLMEEGRVDQYLDPAKYIIQIWTTGTDKLIAELLQKNFRLIFSNYDSWYLDCGFGAWYGEGNNWCSPYKGWQVVYDNSPHDIAVNLTGNSHADKILGGSASLWSEQVDEAALDSKLWPRGSALAERLWTNPSHNWEPAETRLIHQRQRMVARGVDADRIQPQWCHQNEGLCYL